MKYSEAYRNAANDVSVALFGVSGVGTGFAVSFYGVTSVDSFPTIPEPHQLATTGGFIRLTTFTVGDSALGDPGGIGAGTGMDWDTSVLGSVARNPAQTVSGTCIASGYPRFFRIHKILDDPNGLSANNTKLRWQGTLGTTSAYDGILDSTFYSPAPGMTLTTVYPLGNIVDTFGLGS